MKQFLELFGVGQFFQTAPVFFALLGGEPRAHVFLPQGPANLVQRGESVFDVHLA